MTRTTPFWWASIADGSLGKYPTYFRAPYSDCNTNSSCHADVKDLGYHLVHYDLSTEDYLNFGRDQIQQSKDIVKKAISNAPENGNVLALQHDSIFQSSANLTQFILQSVKDKGWKGMLDLPFLRASFSFLNKWWRSAVLNIFVYLTSHTLSTTMS